MNAETDSGFPDDPWIDALVRQSLAEDVGPGDASSAVAVPPSRRARGAIVARGNGVVAGLPLVARVYGSLAPEVSMSALLADGAAVHPGVEVAEIAGPAAALLTGERTALNFLQHLSGIATLTSRYVAAVAGTPCRVLDTRKTLPGYRMLAKYAVRMGGGENHRLGLHDRIMFKDNHWAAAELPIAELVAAARARYPELAVQVEVDGLEQLAQVLPLAIAWILLDNFTPEAAARAVALRDAAAVATELEASGNVTLETVAAFAQAGVDAVSVGRLTHSAPALDLALDWRLEA